MQEEVSTRGVKKQMEVRNAGVIMLTKTDGMHETRRNARQRPTYAEKRVESSQKVKGFDADSSKGVQGVGEARNAARQ